MSTQPSSRRAPVLSIALSNILNLAALILIVGVAYLAWPMIVARFTTGTPITPTPGPATVATQRPYVPPASVPRPAVQEAAPASVPGVYDSPAQAEAAYEEAIQQAELNAAPLPNGSKATNEPPPAAPAYDPTVPEVKYEGVPNPGQGQCLHGQVFTDKGCKNPGNSSKGSK